MPSLNWLGKDKVVAHDLDVPYHSLKRVYIFNAEESEEANNELENMLRKLCKMLDSSQWPLET